MFYILKCKIQNIRIQQHNLYLAIIYTFHYLQMSKQKTELFANDAKDFFGQKSQFFEKN